jgi:hypothetical protein
MSMKGNFNPFRVFQRNQVAFMASLVLLAMISFLILPTIIQIAGDRGPGSQIDTIAECRRFGKVTNFDRYRLEENQESLRRFLDVLLRKLAANAGEDMTKWQALMPLQAEVNRLEQMQSPEQLINVWLVSNYAREEGLSPDWEDISNWLKRITGDQTGKNLNAVYDEAVRDVGMTHQSVEYLLVQHLRWTQSFERFSLSIGAISPATRWDWFQRLFRQITIEAAAVPVDDFIGQVGEPGTKQLTALFEQYKTKRFNPVLAESGFIMPTELAFQYIIAEPTQELLDSITEEEMLAYYEENKDTWFRKPVTPLPTIPGMMPGGATMPFPTPGRPGGLTPTVPGLPDLPKIETEGETTPEPTPTPEEPTMTPAESVNAEEIEETSAVPRVTTRLVVYQPDSTDTTNNPASTEIAEQPSQAEEPKEEGEPKHEEPVAEGEPMKEEPNGEDEPVDLSVLYRPFDEVKDDIRERLAVNKAADRLPIIQAKVREYATVYHQHIEADKQPPAMPDLTGLAAEQGLKLVSVPMGDVYAAMRTDLAREPVERQQIIQMFRRVPMPFETESFLGSNARRVMYWVTDQKNEKRPEKLGEIKDIVAARWKEIEARALAMKKAEELASEVKASGKSLADTLGSRMTVVETEQFTWKIFYPQLGPIPGEVREKGVVSGNSDIDNRVIVAPGNDFMEMVYSLAVGETGVVFNQPQNRAYIVRVTGSSPTDEALWERFQTFSAMPGMDRAYLSAGLPEMMSAAYEAWLDEIRVKTGFRWVNKPEARETAMYDEEY